MSSAVQVAIQPSNDAQATAIATAYALVMFSGKGLPPHINDLDKVAEQVGKMAGLILKNLSIGRTT